jgi:hypothetical protein
MRVDLPERGAELSKGGAQDPTDPRGHDAYKSAAGAGGNHIDIRLGQAEAR